jgi:hypothetical protein
MEHPKHLEGRRLQKQFRLAVATGVIKKAWDKGAKKLGARTHKSQPPTLGV